MNGMEESMRVLVRLCPGNDPQETSALSIDASQKRISFSRERKGVSEFSFSGVLGDTSTQADLFDHCKDVVSDVVNGINCCIFAYGMTGSGKTFSLLGKGWEEFYAENTESQTMDRPPNDEGRGVIPRCIDDIFAKIDALSDQPSFDFSITAQYLQIYNEKIFDLIQDKKRDNPLQLREKRGAPNSVYVQGLSEYKIYSVDDIYDLLRRGARNRAIRSTEMNAESSRSHCILQLFIQIQCLDTATSTTTIHSGLISFVDLAGSEKWRPALSQAGNGQVEVQKEMTNINTSLHVLGNCVSALVEAGRKHIPYRDSVLTRFLQDSIGGDARTILIATVKNSDAYKDETYSTLQFASRASRIKSIVKQNKEIDMTLEQAKKEINLLREQLAKKNEKVERPVSRNNSISSISAPVPTCKCEEYRSTIASLEATITTLRKENSKLVTSLTSLRNDVATLQSESEKKQQQLSDKRRYSSGSDDSSIRDKEYKPRSVASPLVETKRSQALSERPVHYSQQLQKSQQLQPLQHTYQPQYNNSQQHSLSYQYSAPSYQQQPNQQQPQYSYQAATSKQHDDYTYFNTNLQRSTESLRRSQEPIRLSSSMDSLSKAKMCSKHGLEACVLCEMFGDSNIGTSSISNNNGANRSLEMRSSTESKSKNDLCPIHHVTACLLCTLSTTTAAATPVYTASPKYDIPSVPPSLPSVKHFQYSPHAYPGSQDSHSIGYGFAYQQQYQQPHQSYQAQQYQPPQQSYQQYQLHQQHNSYKEPIIDDDDLPDTKFPSLRSSYRDMYPQDSPTKAAPSPKAVRFDSSDDKQRRKSDTLAASPISTNVKTSLTAPNSELKHKPRITYEEDVVASRRPQKIEKPTATASKVAPKKKKKPKAKLPTKSPYNT